MDCLRFKPDHAGAILVVVFLPHEPLPWFRWLKTTPRDYNQNFVLILGNIKHNIVDGFNDVRLGPWRRPFMVLLPNMLESLEVSKSVHSITSPIFAVAEANSWRVWAMVTMRTSLEDQIDLSDLKEVAYFFIIHAINMYQLQSIHDGLGKVWGIRINCLGDIKTLGVEQYVPVHVLKTHPIFSEAMECPIPNLVGVPIKMHRYGPGSDTSTAENPLVSILQRSANRYSDNWGIPPQEWIGGIGSEMVVQCDGIVLLSEHMEAFCAFCCGGFSLLSP